VLADVTKYDPEPTKLVPLYGLNRGVAKPLPMIGAESVRELSPDTHASTLFVKVPVLPVAMVETPVLEPVPAVTSNVPVKLPVNEYAVMAGWESLSLKVTVMADETEGLKTYQSHVFFLPAVAQCPAVQVFDGLLLILGALAPS
jgi:hypothetical protein